MRRLAAALFLVVLPAARLTAHDTDVTRTARAFLALLRPALQAACALPLEGEERTRWSYVPGERRGVTLGQLNASERAAAMEMLRASLSARGYEKTRGVILLEGILRETEGDSIRDPDRYYLTVFGTPSDDRPWAWRFEGHHVSLHFSSASGRVVSETPAFFGANPARVASGPHAGLRVLGSEEDVARKLLASLDARHRAAAVISETAPANILFGPSGKSVPDPAGLLAAQMSEAQRKVLMELVGLYTGNLAEDVARAQTEKITKAGIESIRFAWAGGTGAGEGNYYRVQGPTFVIEYDNTQDHANHVHSVFRDLQNDFGGDLLREHYARSHAPAGIGAAGADPGARVP